MSIGLNGSPQGLYSQIPARAQRSDFTKCSPIPLLTFLGPLFNNYVK
jgi:hypothetical protein